MAAPASVRTVFQSATLAIADWCCGADVGDGGVEEHTEGHTVCVTRRGAYVRHLGRTRTFADPGTAVFYEPGQRYRVTHPVPGGDACTVFRLSEGAVRHLLAPFDPAASARPATAFPVTHQSLDAAGVLLQRRALTAARAGGEPLAVEEAALAFLRRLLGAAKRRGGERLANGTRRAGEGASEYAERVRAVVARRFTESLSLGTIAREVHCSPFHLSRLFLAATGSTIHRHLVRVRLRHALERLHESPDRLATIALDTGFASHSHFTDAFRREFGVPPKLARPRRRDFPARIR